MFTFVILFLASIIYLAAITIGVRAIRTKKFSSSKGAVRATDYGRKAVRDGIIYIVLVNAVYGWFLYKLFISS